MEDLLNNTIDNLGCNEYITIIGNSVYTQNRYYGELISHIDNKICVKISKEYNQYMDGPEIEIEIELK